MRKLISLAGAMGLAAALVLSPAAPASAAEIATPLGGCIVTDGDDCHFTPAKGVGVLFLEAQQSGTVRLTLYSRSGLSSCPPVGEVANLTSRSDAVAAAVVTVAPGCLYEIEMAGSGVGGFI